MNQFNADFEMAAQVERPIVRSALAFQGVCYWDKSEETNALKEDLLFVLSQDDPHAAVIRLAEVKTWSIAGSYGALSAHCQQTLHEIIIAASKDGADLNMPRVTYLTNGDRVEELLEKRRGKCEDISAIQSNIWFNAAIEKTKYKDLSNAYKETIGIQECEDRHRALTQELMR